jgi:thiol-disulfide isomerase/thioredoxin
MVPSNERIRKEFSAMTASAPVRVLILITLAGVLLSSCSPSSPVQSLSDTSRKAALDCTLPDITGASIKLSDYRGKVVLLNFWAAWCGPGEIEIPRFI